MFWFGFGAGVLVGVIGCGAFVLWMLRDPIDMTVFSIIGSLCDPTKK
jgi:hypothetical protein